MHAPRHPARLIYDNRDPRSLAAHLRRKRAGMLRCLIDETLHAKKSCKIIDLGGTREYWQSLEWDFSSMPNLNVTILNTSDVSENDSGVFTYIRGDAASLDHIDDNEFDICHSNSVIEHVGDWNRKKSFADGVRKVAKKYFVQTPNFWFPVELHFVTPFFHWLPKPVRISMVASIELGWYRKANSLDEAVTAVEENDLLTYRMMQCLFPDAVIYRERILFATKSLVAVRDKGADAEAPRVNRMP